MIFRKYFGIGAFVLALGIAIFFGLSQSATYKDCYASPPEEIRSLIRRDFFRRIDSKSWQNRKDFVAFRKESIQVALPILSKGANISELWSTTVTAQALTDGSQYTYVVYYTCSRGVEYSVAEKNNAE